MEWTITRMLYTKITILVELDTQLDFYTGRPTVSIVFTLSHDVRKV